jgi:uncharacterized protein YlxP (DUF503 family)
VHEEIIDKGKSWDTVIQELGIFTQDTNQILDLDKSAISELKAQGLSDNTIIDISIVSRNTKINYKEISQELNKDLTKTDLSSLAASVAMSDGIDGKETNRIDNNLEDIERIKKKYNITDDDISKCEKNGITKIEEVGFLKILSNKHSIEMDELLKIMKEEKSLEKVQQKLEVDLNAK